MKTIFTLLITSLFLSVQAQNFYFEPSDNIEKTIVINDISDLNIDIMRSENVDTLLLKYELISSTLPDSWYQGYCDNHGCWGSLPESGTMSPMYEDLNSYIRLSINPNGIEGSGTVEYYVFEDGHYEDGLHMTFTAHTPGFVGITQIEGLQLKYFPNPVIDRLHLEAKEAIQEIKVYELTGKLVFTASKIETSNFEINMEDWNSGIYLMEIFNTNSKKETRRIIKK